MATRGEGSIPDENDDPIEFLYGEHERIRRVCERLAALAENPGVASEAARLPELLRFLEFDLKQHIADEEGDLFPLLRARAQRGEHILDVIELLSREHADDIEAGAAVRRVLERMVRGEPPKDPELFADYLRGYVRLQRHHQALENREVIPYAAEHLSAEELAELMRRFVARRRQA